MSTFAEPPNAATDVAQETKPTVSYADPNDAYDQALSITRSGDLVSWRRLIASQRSKISTLFAAWRDDAQKTSLQSREQLPDFVRAGVTSFQVLFAVSIAGIESGEAKFNTRPSLLYDFLEPKGWVFSGSTIIVYFPETVAWVFHSLIGAMCIHTGQTGTALKIANQRVSVPCNSNDSSPLFLSHRLTGWLESLSSCTGSWTVLWELSKYFPWIIKAFGDEDAFHEGLCGYYLMLSWMEFINVLKSGNADKLDSGDYRLDLPATFLRNKEYVRGMRQLLDNNEPLIRFADKNGVGAASQIENWPKWVDVLGRWLANALQSPFAHEIRGEILHFAEDIHR